MKVFDLTKTKLTDAGVMAFGFFDSLHIGHKKVISDAIDLAKDKGTVSSVFLFKNNIYPLLEIAKCPIFDFEERVSFIRDLGVDRIFYVEADKEFLSMSPDAFIAFLKEHLTIQAFTCGKDFTFGREGKGTPADLISSFGEGVISDLLLLDGEKVGTDRVKQALSEGNIPFVERLLGRKFSLKRVVFGGRHDGEKMGFPTVNTALGSAPIKSGVYLTNVITEGKMYHSVTNVGDHPTFADSVRNIESHLLDFDGDLYGRDVEIEFLFYLRPIEKFSSPEELARRIAEDVNVRRNYD